MPENTMRYSLMAAGLIILACGTTAQADGVYKWTDAQGRIHYGDRPQSNTAQPLNIKPAPPVPQQQPEAQEKQNGIISNARKVKT